MKEDKTMNFLPEKLSAVSLKMILEIYGLDQMMEDLVYIHSQKINSSTLRTDNL